MRSDISSLQHRPPNYLISRGHEDPLLLKEWILVLRGDGKSSRTIEGYADSVRQLADALLGMAAEWVQAHAKYDNSLCHR